MDSFYTINELSALGLKSFGTNVLISRKSSLYKTENIELGNNVRIDDFCILSGRIKIGSYIHIAAYSALYGGDAGIEIDDFSNISSRVSIYAISDDYSGMTMTNPMIPDQYKSIQMSPVHIYKHVIIGSGSVILPGVCIKEGAACGALSLVKDSLEQWGIYAGIPAKKLKNREKKLLELEQRFISEEDQ